MFAPVASFVGSSPAQISWFVLSLSLSIVPPVIFIGGLVVRTEEATSDPAWHTVFPVPAPRVGGRDLHRTQDSGKEIKGCFLLAGLGDTVPFSFTLSNNAQFPLSCLHGNTLDSVLVLVGAVLGWPHRLVSAILGQSAVLGWPSAVLGWPWDRRFSLGRCLMCSGRSPTRT